MTDPLRIEKLRADHAVSGFDCGTGGAEPLPLAIRPGQPSRRCRSNLRSTFRGESCRLLLAGSGRSGLSGCADRLTKGLARHPVPIMLLARLAVSSGSQGQGIGAGLLKDAMLRTVQAADIAGIRALAVHAKDEHARRFHEHLITFIVPGTRAGCDNHVCCPRNSALNTRLLAKPHQDTRHAPFQVRSVQLAAHTNPKR